MASRSTRSPPTRNRRSASESRPWRDGGATLSGLLDTSNVRFEDEPAIEGALFTWKDATVDFADCLIGAKNRRLGCRATATFDAKAGVQKLIRATVRLSYLPLEFSMDHGG